MAIEIVSFSIKNGGSFHSYVSLPEGKGRVAWDTSGTARLLLARLAPWEPMCRRCQETHGGLGLWLGSEWGRLKNLVQRLQICVWAMSPLQFWHRGQPFQGAMQCRTRTRVWNEFAERTESTLTFKIQYKWIKWTMLVVHWSLQCGAPVR